MNKLLLTIATMWLVLVVFPSYAAERQVQYIAVPETFSDMDEWKPVIQQLNNARNKTIIFKWRGFGGRHYIGVKVIDAVIRAKRWNVVVFDIIGYSASMHGLVPCWGDSIIRRATLMYHAANYDNRKLNYTPWANNKDRKWHRECVKAGVLTEADIDAMLSGKQEVYVLKDGRKVYRPDKRLKK